MLPPDPARGVFCNRTLNLRRVHAIGYDMDYTLVHYHVERWEERAYHYVKERLRAQGWPVEGLQFDPGLVSVGLVIDTARGNLVKADRFGYVKQAMHGTAPLPYEEQRTAYRHVPIDLENSRWRFLNTLFSVSEAGLYLQLVDLLDADQLPPSLGYDSLYAAVRTALDEAHIEGLLKAEILADPERYVDLDPEVPLTLLDQKHSGKKVVLITNSEWSYAAPMLAYAFDRFLPGDMTWRDVFSLAIVGARKPGFFSGQAPAFHIVDEDEDGEPVLKEHRGPMEEGHAYVGGNAALVERSLGLSGDEILYVGDHVYADVRVSKSLLRWRTALILRAIEEEAEAYEGFQQTHGQLAAMMREKERLESAFSDLRLERQRNETAYGPQTGRDLAELQQEADALREHLVQLDARIRPVARAASELMSSRWGPLMRAGKDKSLLARQVERSADLYTGRVSSFLRYTPFMYFRSHRGSLPHDPTPRDAEAEATELA